MRCSQLKRVPRALFSFTTIILLAAGFHASGKDDVDVAAENKKAQTNGYYVKEVTFSGDTDLVHSVKLPVAGGLLSESLAKAIRKECINKHLSEDEVIALCSRYTQILKDQNYKLATITLVKFDVENKILALAVNTARNGKASFYQYPRRPLTGQFWTKRFWTQWWTTGNQNGKKESFKGRYYSQKQLRRRLELEKGTAFNYGDFYSNILSVNSLPDLTLDGNLKVRMGQEQNKRSVDIDYIVKETIPLHLALSVSNDGTETTDKWRSKVKFQYLNLTKNFDVLSIEAGSSLNETVKWLSGSYYFPLPFAWDTSFTLYGSKTWVEVDDITPQVNAEGEGHIYGLQINTKLLPFEKHIFSLTTGLSDRYSRNNIIAGGVSAETEVQYRPLKFTLDYHTKTTDQLGGRTFLSGSYLVNREDFLGGDGTDEFELVRVGAEADFEIIKAKAARIQKLGFKNWPKWLLYLKAEGQYTDSPLIPVEQMSAGGMKSVRGYAQREALGDRGVIASIELRTPLMSHKTFKVDQWYNAVENTLFNNFFRDDKVQAPEEAENKPIDTFQFLVFTDYGYVRRLEPQPGEFETVNMLSVGVGTRLTLWNHLNMRLDYGVPLKATTEETGDTETSGDGAVHFALEMQF